MIIRSWTRFFKLNLPINIFRLWSLFFSKDRSLAMASLINTWSQKFCFRVINGAWSTIKIKTYEISSGSLPFYRSIWSLDRCKDRMWCTRVCNSSLNNNIIIFAFSQHGYKGCGFCWNGSVIEVFKCPAEYRSTQSWSNLYYFYRPLIPIRRKSNVNIIIMVCCNKILSEIKTFTHGFAKLKRRANLKRCESILARYC